jgi:hypothetical protein
MEYRTNRVNSAGIEPKKFECDGPKISPARTARTEISKTRDPQIFMQQISEKIIKKMA